MLSVIASPPPADAAISIRISPANSFGGLVVGTPRLMPANVDSRD
jgi:hypothetical protein